MLEGLIGGAVFGIGFIAGIATSFYLIERYKRDASAAIEEAKQQAYNTFINHLNEQREKVNEMEDSGTFQNNVHEAQEEFEKSMERLGYKDKEKANDARDASGESAIE